MLHADIDKYPYHAAVIVDGAIIWAAPSDYVSSSICEMRMLRSACASTHADQELGHPLYSFLKVQRLCKRNAKTLSAHFAHAVIHILAWRGPFDDNSGIIFLISP